MTAVRSGKIVNRKSGQTAGRKSGQITVFLSLMLILIISFLMSLVRFTLIQLSRDQAYVISEIAIESIMGEFNKEAMEEYDLFLLDGGYRTGNYSTDKVIQHYEDYISYKTQMDKDIYTICSPLDWGCELSEDRISAIELATDNGGRSVIRQLAAYMEDTYGVSYIQDLVNGYTISNSSNYKSGGSNENNLKDSISDANARQDAENATANVQTSETTVDESDEEDSENAEKAAQARQNSLSLGNWISTGMNQAAYGLVVKNKSGVSEKTCNNSNLTYARRNSGNLRTGYGSVPVPTSENKLSDAVLFKAYLLQELNCYSDETQTDSSLDYELEYLLCGKSGDKENLGAVAARLLLIRSAINMVVLVTDKSISGELDAIVDAVSAAIPVPGINLIIQAVLKVIWSVIESVVELRDLFSGGKMEPVKTAANWRTSAEKLPEIIIDFITGGSDDISETVSQAADEADNGETGSTGLNYKQWLMVLIGLEKQDKVCFRYMDLVEMNIHRLQGNDSFKMDDCITGLTIVSTWRTAGGETDIEVSYAYR